MKFGITQIFGCSYLPDEREQLLVYADSTEQLALRYGQLIQVGFRRSGEQIYRPHCPDCNACQSVRIPVDAFTPSRSQKRVKSVMRTFLLNVRTRKIINTIHCTKSTLMRGTPMAVCIRHQKPNLKALYYVIGKSPSLLKPTMVTS